MKVIDLLNKIANGEVPKKVLFHGFLYRVEGNNYYSKDTDEYLINDLRILNETVEIIEDTPKIDDAVLRRYFTDKEDKKIEHIDYLTFNDFSNENKVWYLENKINEIIDKVNGEDNE